MTSETGEACMRDPPCRPYRASVAAADRNKLPAQPRICIAESPHAGLRVFTMKTRAYSAQPLLTLVNKSIEIPSRQALPAPI